ncbi:MAG: F0F1 ATP synthase subunit delta [Verrucomicrobiota bacterium]
MIIPLIIIQIVVFAALVIFLRKMIFSSSSSASSKIQQMSAETDRKAAELSRQVSEIEEQCRQKIVEAEKAVGVKLDEAAEEAARIKSGLIHKAQEEASAVITQAHSAKDRMRREIEEQMRTKCVPLALKLLNTVLTSGRSRFLHEAIIDEILGEIETQIKKSGWQIPDNVTQAKIITPHPLPSALIKKLAETMSNFAGRKLAMEEVVNQEVLAGCVIQAGTLTIDGSLTRRLEDAAQEAISEWPTEPDGSAAANANESKKSK